MIAFDHPDEGYAPRMLTHRARHAGSGAFTGVERRQPSDFRSARHSRSGCCGCGGQTWMNRRQTGLLAAFFAQNVEYANVGDVAVSLGLISKQDLIENKILVVRLRDLADAEELSSIP
jgi:hypothetical protein